MLSLLVVGAGAQTVPLLPDRYTLTVEANIVNSRFSVYQREIYDYPNDRARFDVQQPEAFVHVIDLVGPRVLLSWTTTDGVMRPDNCVATPSNGDPFFVSDDAGNLRTSNDFLGSSPDDEYLGPSTARGITTDAFLHNTTNYTIVTEYSSDWLSPFGSVPVRATLTGKIRPFFHVYEFFDYVPSASDNEFTIPFEISFEVGGPGVCNATLFADDAVAQAALLDLAVFEQPTVTETKKSTKQDTTLAAVLAVVMFVVGVVGGVALLSLVRTRRQAPPATLEMTQTPTKEDAASKDAAQLT